MHGYAHRCKYLKSAWCLAQHRCPCVHAGRRLPKAMLGMSSALSFHLMMHAPQAAGALWRGVARDQIHTHKAVCKQLSSTRRCGGVCEAAEGVELSAAEPAKTCVSCMQTLDLAAGTIGCEERASSRGGGLLRSLQAPFAHVPSTWLPSGSPGLSPASRSAVCAPLDTIANSTHRICLLFVADERAERALTAALAPLCSGLFCFSLTRHTQQGTATTFRSRDARALKIRMPMYTN